ncbi:MAG TPA: hypothetical protein VEJ22_05170 [Nitrospirota bacterium]|nr:hypothetical protein [Nitrospirota bacterium]
MQRLSPVLRYSVLMILLAVAVVSGGCSVTVMPNKVPPVSGLDAVSLTGVSLIITNAEQDPSLYDVPNDKGQKLGILVNRQAWSKVLVETLASELAGRGAQVRVNAPLKLAIMLPDIMFNQIKSNYQFKVKVAVSSSSGWAKTYDAVAQTESGLFESSDALMDRLAGQVLAEATKAMLSDAEFLVQLRGKS